VKRDDTIGKGAVALFCCTAAILLPPWIRLALALLLCVLPFVHPEPFVHRPPQKTARRIAVAYVSLGFALIVAMNALLVHHGTILFAFMGVRASSDGLRLGFEIASRYATLTLAVALFFITTPVDELVDSLERVRAPSSLVFVVSFSYFLVSQLPSRISQILIAQESRGAPVRSSVFGRSTALFSIVSPLILSSIVESLDRSVALELRASNRSAAASRIIQSPRMFSPPAVIFLVLTIILVLGSMFRWLFQ